MKKTDDLDLNFNNFINNHIKLHNNYKSELKTTVVS